MTDLDEKLRALHDTVCRGGFDDGGVTNCGSLCHVFDDLRTAADLALEAAAQIADEEADAGRKALPGLTREKLINQLDGGIWTAQDIARDIRALRTRGGSTEAG